MSRRNLISLLMAGLVTALVLVVGMHWYQQTQSNRAHEFALQDLDGHTQRMSDWKGKVVLLNFWAPWCVPCRKEIPMLMALQQDLGPQGLQVVGLSVDQLQNVRAFVRQQPISYPVLIGLDAILHLQDSYGETRLPYSVIIDRDGIIRQRQLGGLHRDQLGRILRPLLNSK